MSSASLLPNAYFNKLDVNRLSALQLKVGKKVSPESSDSTNEPSWLFSLDISEASYNANEYTLTFKKSNVNIIRFSDRPFRIATTESVNDLEELFTENTENSFTEDPPNGVLVMKQGQSAFEILKMSVKDGIVKYELRSLSNENFVSESGKMSFFIDNSNPGATATANGLAKITTIGPGLTLSNGTLITTYGGSATYNNFTWSSYNAPPFKDIQWTSKFNSCGFLGTFTSCSFTGTFQSCIFNGTFSSSCVFSDNFYGCSFTGTFQSCSFKKKANLQYTTYQSFDMNTNKIYGANLTDVDFTGADFTGANFTGANLIGANLSGATITWAQIQQTANWKNNKNLSGINFTGFDFTSVNLTGANLSGATITWAQIQQTANWTGRGKEGNSNYIAPKDLSGINFTGFDFSNANLTGANLTNATITWAQIEKTANWTGQGTQGSANYIAPKDLSGINFTGFDFSNVNLTGAIITGANLTNTNITWAQIEKTANWTGQGTQGSANYIAPKDLSGINFTGFDFSNVNLKGANLTGANLSGATITGANLSGAKITWEQIKDTQNAQGLRGKYYPFYFPGINFTGFNFSNVNLTTTNEEGAFVHGADFSNATLTNATLTKANFTNATLSGCDFTNAQNINEAKFNNAIIHGTYSIGGITQSPNNKGYISRNSKTSSAPTWALITHGAKFLGNGTGGVPDGFTFAQLQSTISYQKGDLTGVNVGSVSNPDGNYPAGRALHVISSFAYAQFPNCIFRNLDLTRCDAAYCNFFNTTIQHTIFSWYIGGKLQSATNFYNAYLYGATIQNVDMSGVNWLDASWKENGGTSGNINLAGVKVSSLRENNKIISIYELDQGGNRNYAITQAQNNLIDSNTPTVPNTPQHYSRA